MPPLAAMRDEAATPQPPTRRRTIVSWALLIVGRVAILLGLFGGRRRPVRRSACWASARSSLFIAVALLSPRLVPPIAAAVGYPLERLRGVAGRLARENALRNPSRTAVTAAALMIGLALVTFVSILAAGVKASIDDTVSKDMKAQIVVLNKDGFSPISPETGDALKRVPGVRDRLAAEHVPGQGRRRQRQAVRERDRPGARSTRSGTCTSTRGRPTCCRRSADRDIALEKDWAEDNNFDLGDTSEGDHAGRRKAGPEGARRRTRTRGDWSATSWSRTTSSGATSACGTTSSSSSPYSRVPTRRRSRHRIDRVLEQRFPIAEAQNRQEFKDSITGQVDQFLFLIYALLSLSVIVSLFGIVNTLVLSIHERTREIGMMRAIGTPRSLVRRIVRYESVITALIGAALGLTVGFFLGVVTTVALEDEGFILSIPFVSLIVFAVLAVLAGVLAAIPPARRASRLNVLEALAYE